MKRNKLSSKKQIVQDGARTNKAHLPIFWLLLCLATLAAIALYIFLIAPSLSKASAQKQAVDLIAKVNLPGTLVYSDAYEQCSGENNALFGESKRCGFTAYRVYRNSESATNEVQTAKSTLANLGFKPSREVEIAAKGVMPYYLPDQPDVAATIEYATTTADSGIIFGRQTIPYNNENLYGVRVHVTY